MSVPRLLRRFHSFVCSFLDEICVASNIASTCRFRPSKSEMKCAFKKTDVLSNTLIVVSGGRTYQAGDGQYDQTRYRQSPDSSADRKPNAQEIQKRCPGGHRC